MGPTERAMEEVSNKFQDQALTLILVNQVILARALDSIGTSLRGLWDREDFLP